MLWKHNDHPDREVHLAYCLNLHAAEEFGELLQGMREVTLPLKERLAEGRPFGVGMYLAAPLASELTGPMGQAKLDELIEFLRENQLDPFTYNAFPHGGFHAESLKERVFEPTWKQEARVEYTIHVATIAAAIAKALDREGTLSISTHTGMFGADLNAEDDLYLCAMNFVRAAREIGRTESSGGPRIILSLEPEPRASAGDTAAVRQFLEQIIQWGSELMSGDGAWSIGRATEHLQRYLGVCFDCCHSAVEFESPDLALREATTAGNSIGKLQFSNAIRLVDPMSNERGRKSLFALDEPRYLHQVTGASDPRDPNEARSKVRDLPELQAVLASDARERADWEACTEWRCHFHVPVDLADLGEDSGLATTRPQSDRLLDLALGTPTLWNNPVLHLEIETYTWDLLAGAARGRGDLVDGLEREYRHTIARLENAGWQRA